MLCCQHPVLTNILPALILSYTFPLTGPLVAVGSLPFVVGRLEPVGHSAEVELGFRGVEHHRLPVMVVVLPSSARFILFPLYRQSCVVAVLLRRISLWLLRQQLLGLSGLSCFFLRLRLVCFLRLHSLSGHHYSSVHNSIFSTLALFNTFCVCGTFKKLCGVQLLQFARLQRLFLSSQTSAFHISCFIWIISNRWSH